MALAITVALVIIAVVINLIIKNTNPAIGQAVTIAICVMIIFISVEKLSAVMEMIEQLYGYINIDNSYLVILFKMVGISYICEFGAGICRDSGYSSVATQINMVGRLTILVVGLPIILSVINSVVGVLG